MKISIKLLVISIMVIIFGGIGISNIAGLWKTESEKLPQKIQSGEFAGNYNPMDIKGSFTFEDISKTFGIPLDDLAESFGIPKSKVSAFKCKDLKDLYSNTDGVEIGTDSVRIFVAFYKGITVDLSSDSYLPINAKEVIIKKGKPTREQINYLENHVVKLK